VVYLYIYQLTRDYWNIDIWHHADVTYLLIKELLLPVLCMDEWYIQPCSLSTARVLSVLQSMEQH